MNVKQRSRAAISQEIILRERTVNKFTLLAEPLNSAIAQLKRRLAHEKKVIAALVEELKERDEGE